MSLFTSRFLSCSVALLGLSGTLQPAASQTLNASEQSEVQSLANAGKPAQALKLVEDKISKSPEDLQLKFQHAVLLSMLNRKPEALEAFKKLVVEHPNMAPAYNNMAVIYSDMSDFDSAKTALEKAVSISPDYATAYQNLGDVYVQLATQAYQKSLQVDKSDSTVKPKIELLHQALTLSSDEAAQRKGAPAVAPRSPASASATATRLSAPLSTTEARDLTTEDVLAVIRHWAAAWSNRDAASYIGDYASDFAGQSGSHEAWVRERTKRIMQRSHIKVEISDLASNVIGDKAEVQFRQSYQSDGPKEASHKTLNMARNAEGQWLIVKETSSP